MYNGSKWYRVYAGSSAEYLKSASKDAGISFTKSQKEAVQYGYHYALRAVRFARACGCACWLVRA